MKIKRVVEIVIIVLVAMLLILLFFGTKTFTFDDNIKDEGSFTYTIAGLGSRLSCVLTSTGDYMYLKVTVDGQTVYEQNNVYDVNFDYDIGFGAHTINITIENPKNLLELGSTIHLSGKISLSLW